MKTSLKKPDIFVQHKCDYRVQQAYNPRLSKYVVMCKTCKKWFMTNDKDYK